MKNKTSLDAFELCILEKSDPRLIVLWETGTLQIDDLFYILVEQIEQHDYCDNQSSFPETSQGPTTMSNGSLATYNDCQQPFLVNSSNTLVKEFASDPPSILPFNGNQEHNQSHVTQGEINSNTDTDSLLSQTSINGRFSCPQCGRMFNRLPNLNAHKLTHSKNRPKEYECSVCGDRFLYKYDKTRHNDSKHNGIRYPCLCGKSYSRNSNLKRHIRDKHKL